VGLGKVALAGRAVAINQDIKALHPHDGIIPEYLYWHMLAHGPTIARMGVGATVKGITLQDLRGLPLRVPPPDEQRRIVDLLNRTASLKRLAEQAQAKARVLIPALFVDTFGDPATNPKGWPTVTLGDHFAVKGGKRLPAGSSYAVSPTQHPYIRGTDIHPGSIDSSDLRYLEPETQRCIARYIVGELDVAITIAGKIGVAAPIPRELVGANLTENAAVIRPLEGVQIEPMYIAAQLNGPQVQRQIEALTGRVTIGKLALERIKKLKLFLPDVEVQRNFSAKVRLVQSVAHLAKQAADVADLGSAALMARLFA
jgi:type I restriction enzyme S subunit